MLLKRYLVNMMEEEISLVYQKSKESPLRTSKMAEYILANAILGVNSKLTNLLFQPKFGQFICSTNKSKTRQFYVRQLLREFKEQEMMDTILEAADVKTDEPHTTSDERRLQLLERMCDLIALDHINGNAIVL